MTFEVLMFSEVPMISEIPMIEASSIRPCHQQGTVCVSVLLQLVGTLAIHEKTVKHWCSSLSRALSGVICGLNGYSSSHIRRGGSQVGHCITLPDTMFVCLGAVRTQRCGVMSSGFVNLLGSTQSIVRAAFYTAVRLL